MKTKKAKEAVKSLISVLSWLVGIVVVINIIYVIFLFANEEIGGWLVLIDTLIFGAFFGFLIFKLKVAFDGIIEVMDEVMD